MSELILPANEPGSPSMPGKVNPTQCEAMIMVCIQVLSEDSAIAFAGSQGNFELNVMRPIITSNFLHSATILGDACGKLLQYCIEGTELASGPPWRCGRLISCHSSCPWWRATRCSRCSA